MHCVFYNELRVLLGNACIINAMCVLLKRIQCLFRVSTFAKPECDNVLQPDPRSVEGCNTLINEGFANFDTRKRMLYRHCYIPS